MSKSKPLVITADDDAEILKVVRFRLERWGYRVIEVPSKKELLARLSEEFPAVLLLDLRFGESDGLEVLRELLSRMPQLIVVMLTGHGSIDNAVSAMKMGAFDYLTKPVQENRLQIAVQHAVEKFHQNQRIAQLEEQLLEKKKVSRPILGTSSLIRRLHEEIDSVAPTDATVFIHGESGTGKELVARAIHERSQRSGGPFIPLNMAALPRELVESTLFGHEKGVFTGATQTQKGSCELADGGTLFLDEIGEMDIHLQAKLLRFLQEQIVQRVGSAKPIAVDVRIVTATNRNPEAIVKAGTLRADLYHRLNVVRLSLPPLRNRREDIPLLAAHFLRRFNERTGKAIESFDKATMDVLCQYSWPGNVRELENMVERMAIFCRNQQITADLIPNEILEAENLPAPASPSPKNDSPHWQPDSPSDAEPSDADGDSEPETGIERQLKPFERMERAAIIEALEQSGGHVAEAAQRLGFGQATVYRKIKRYEIPLNRNRKGQSE